MTKFDKVAIVALALLSPLMTLHAASDVEGTLGQIKNILNLIIGLLFVLVTLWFIWGIVQYVMASGDEEKIKDGKNHMIWGIIGMAVMAGAWGIVNILLQTFGVGSASIPTGPRQN